MTIHHCLQISACVSRNRFSLVLLMTEASHTCHSSEARALWVATVQLTCSWKVTGTWELSTLSTVEHNLRIPITVQCFGDWSKQNPSPALILRDISVQQYKHLRRTNQEFLRTSKTLLLGFIFSWVVSKNLIYISLANCKVLTQGEHVLILRIIPSCLGGWYNVHYLLFRL